MARTEPAWSEPAYGAGAPAAGAAIKALLELLKPITWFAPMWAFACGVVSSGVPAAGHWALVIGGVALAGPLVCGTSQAVNDWFDRTVDAINEPRRPIPSGRVPGNRALHMAIAWTMLSLLIATMLGTWATAAAVLGLGLAWAYSAPPLRLKRNGWWGNAACALCYEGLPWYTGAAVMSAVRPDWRVTAVAVLYSLGAHGIMTLNDFKSVEGDRQTGIDSLPVLLGVRRAAVLACLVMTVPQATMVLLLDFWGLPLYSAAVVVLLGTQIVLMGRLLQRPQQMAAWYNATGTGLYVAGMMVCAFAIRPAGLS